MTRAEEAENILSGFETSVEAEGMACVFLKLREFLHSGGTEPLGKSEVILQGLKKAYESSKDVRDRAFAVADAYKPYRNWKNKIKSAAEETESLTKQRREYELKLVLEISVNEALTPDEVISRARRIAELVYPPVEVSTSFNAS